MLILPFKQTKYFSLYKTSQGTQQYLEKLYHPLTESPGRSKKEIFLAMQQEYQCFSNHQFDFLPHYVDFMDDYSPRDNAAGGSTFGIRMEYIEGTSLSSFLKNRSPAVKEINTFLSILCQRMITLYDAGILHLDIRGENIIIPSPKAFPDFRVLDLTFAYMDPERYPAFGWQPSFSSRLEGCLHFCGRSLENPVKLLGLELLGMAGELLGYEMVTSFSSVRRLIMENRLPSLWSNFFYEGFRYIKDGELDTRDSHVLLELLDYLP